jgi:hypothetical protein
MKMRGPMSNAEFSVCGGKVVTDDYPFAEMSGNVITAREAWGNKLLDLPLPDSGQS